MIKKAIFFLCLFVTAISASSQITAVTNNGDQVILYNDGTWKYTDKTESENNKIDTNKTVFTKSKDASFLLKSNICNVGINLNPKKWSFKKATTNADAEYSLQLKEKDAYGMLIAERIEVPLETLKSVALENAKNVAPDMKIVKEEYRVVNGTTVLCMQMDGTTKGIKFSYLGYYFSSEKGSVQFVTFTSQSLLKEYKQDLEDLLNGFVVL